MKRKLYVLRLLTIALMFLVAVNPVLAKPGEPKGKLKGWYDVLFDGGITGSGTAGVVNQWGMGIYGMNRITLDFMKSVDWIGELKGLLIDFSGEHENGELGLHTKDKGDTVRMKFSIIIPNYQHAFVFEATGTVVGPWIEDSFSIVFTDTPATIRYSRRLVWDEKLSFTITVTKPA